MQTAAPDKCAGETRLASRPRQDLFPAMANIASMANIELDNRDIRWSVRFSNRRKTIQLRVAGLDLIAITAPVGTATARLMQVLQEKRTWILRQMHRLEQEAACSTNASLTHGATLLYQGVPHSLLLLADGRGKTAVTRQHGAISVHLTELVGYDGNPVVQQALQKWYAEQARVRLLERTSYWATHIGVRPLRVKLGDQKTRWGSCSTHGSIHYNWRIIMAPPPVLDYLVIHELCHLLQPNHSPKYWQEVCRWCPDYALHRRWLRQNGGLLGKIFNF